jgi:hypothetical protein
MPVTGESGTFIRIERFIGTVMTRRILQDFSEVEEEKIS